jgi:hypothetical protein
LDPLFRELIARAISNLTRLPMVEMLTWSDDELHDSVTRLSDIYHLPHPDEATF